VPAHPYTRTSGEARDLGRELLQLSRSYRDPLLPHGYGAERMGVVAAVARARRLLSAAYSLSDRGDGLEAGALTRGILETAFTLGWLKADAELGFLIWMLDDQRSTLKQHEEVRRIERNRRQRARRVGQPLTPIAPQATLGLLDRSSLRRYRHTVADLEKRIRALPRLKRRLRKLRPVTFKPGGQVKAGHINQMPGFLERAKVAGLEDIYALIYPFDSRTVVHPSPLALEQFLESRSDGVVVHAEPQRPRPDPYGVGAVVFAILIDVASELLPDFDLQTQTEALLPRLSRIQMHA
jgi:Family of unknown function (DUF5677)